MSRRILYAYVEGSDLERVADFLDARFQQFVNSRHWTAGHASLVNQRHRDETCTRSEDLPSWDLGLNLELPNPGAEPPGWFADVEAVALFLGKLHGESGRNFVIGISDTKTGITDDLFAISTHLPDLDKLRSIIGIGDVQ